MGAVGSVVSQKVSSDLAGEKFKIDAKQLLADTIWGAVDGAISFSPLTGKVLIFANVVSTAGSTFTDELIDDEEGINFTRMGWNLFANLATSKLELDSMGETNISESLSKTKKTINKLSNRSNVKWASKQITRLTDDFSQLLFCKTCEDGFNGFINTGKGLLFQGIYDKASDVIASTFVSSNLPKEPVTSRK